MDNMPWETTGSRRIIVDDREFRHCVLLLICGCDGRVAEEAFGVIGS